MVTASSLQSSQQVPVSVATLPQEFKQTVGKRSDATATMSRLPAWVAYDRKVLRFFAYFSEPVYASNVETWRVRKCVICYHLEDDSIQITEPRVENSGIPQGVFVKRHRVPKSEFEYYQVHDLYVGGEIAIYGRIFKIVDCDSFTRVCS